MENLLTAESSRLFLLCEVNIEDVKVASKTVTVSNMISKKVISLSNDKEVYLILREKSDCSIFGIALASNPIEKDSNEISVTFMCLSRPIYVQNLARGAIYIDGIEYSDEDYRKLLEAYQLSLKHDQATPLCEGQVNLILY